MFKRFGIDDYTQVASDLMVMVGGCAAGIDAIQGFRRHVKPDLTIINFVSDELDIFSLGEKLAAIGLGACINPAAERYARDAVHVTCTDARGVSA